LEKKNVKYVFSNTDLAYETSSVYVKITPNIVDQTTDYTAILRHTNSPALHNELDGH